MNRSIVSQIKHAIERGLEEKVRHLIKAHGRYLSKQNIKSLLLYMKRHKAYSYSVVEYIFVLSPNRHDFMIYLDNGILPQVIKSSNVEVVRLLLLDERFGKEYIDRSKTNSAGEYKIYPVVGGKYHTELHTELLHACRNSDTQMLRLLIDADQFALDPNAHDGLALCTASESGHVDMVRLLMADPRIDIKKYGMRALSSACIYNHVRIVQILLSDDRLDLSKYSLNIKYYCSSGHSGTIEPLLKDSRFYSNFAKNAKTYISRAAQTGKIDTVQLLLRECARLEEMNIDTDSEDSDESFESSEFDESNLPEIRMDIENAVIRGYTEVVRLLLEDTYFRLLDPKTALHLACQNERMEIVRLLMNRTNFDPSYSNNGILLSVCRRAQRSVLRILLTDERIVERGLSGAIRVADEIGDEEMCMILECEQTKYKSKYARRLK